jgi:hypothetical protein
MMFKERRVVVVSMSIIYCIIMSRIISLKYIYFIMKIHGYLPTLSGGAAEEVTEGLAKRLKVLKPDQNI